MEPEEDFMALWSVNGAVVLRIGVNGGPTWPCWSQSITFRSLDEKDFKKYTNLGIVALRI
jgi:hypothetical protein